MSVSLSGTVSESVPYHAAVKSVKTSILPYGRLAYLYKLTDFFPLLENIFSGMGPGHPGHWGCKGYQLHYFASRQDRESSGLRCKQVCYENTCLLFAKHI